MAPTLGLSARQWANIEARRQRSEPWQKIYEAYPKVNPGTLTTYYHLRMKAQQGGDTDWDANYLRDTSEEESKSPFLQAKRSGLRGHENAVPSPASLSSDASSVQGSTHPVRAATTRRAKRKPVTFQRTSSSGIQVKRRRGENRGSRDPSPLFVTTSPSPSQRNGTLSSSVRAIHDASGQANQALIDVCDTQVDNAYAELDREEDAHSLTTARLTEAESALIQLTQRFDELERTTRTKDTDHHPQNSQTNRIGSPTKEVDATKASQSTPVDPSQSESLPLCNKNIELDSALVVISSLRSKVELLTQEVKRTEHHKQAMTKQLDSVLTKGQEHLQTIAKVYNVLEAIRSDCRKLAGTNSKVLNEHQSIVSEFEAFYGFLPFASDTTRKDAKEKLLLHNEDLKKLIKTENKIFVGSYHSIKTLLAEVEKNSSSSAENERLVSDDNINTEIPIQRSHTRLEPERHISESRRNRMAGTQPISNLSTLSESGPGSSSKRPRVSFDLPPHDHSRNNPRRMVVERPSDNLMNRVAEGAYCNQYHLDGTCTRPHCRYRHGSRLKGTELDALRWLEQTLERRGGRM